MEEMVKDNCRKTEEMVEDHCRKTEEMVKDHCRKTQEMVEDHCTKTKEMHSSMTKELKTTKIENLRVRFVLDTLRWINAAVQSL